MKHRMNFLIGTLLTLILAIGCAPDLKGEYRKTVDAYYGVVKEEHYSNSWLKAELDLPANWHVQEDPIKAEIVSAGDRIKDQQALAAAVKIVETSPVYNLLQVFKNPLDNQREFNPSLVMMVERIDGKDVKNAEAYLEASRKVMAQRQMPMGFKQNLDAPLDAADIGGMEFSHLPIVIDTTIVKINQDYYGTMLGDKMLGFMISWQDESEKIEMMNALSTLIIGE